MLVDELPLIVQAYPRVAGLELHEGGEDEVLSRALILNTLIPTASVFPKCIFQVHLSKVYFLK